MKIQHRFDPSLDAHPDLKRCALEAAEELDREAAESELPTEAVWRLNRHALETHPIDGVEPRPIEVELRDPNMPVVFRQSFSPKKLRGDDRVLPLLRLWSNFLGLRNHLLVERAVEALTSGEQLAS